MKLIQNRAVAVGIVKTIVQNTKRGDPDQSLYVYAFTPAMNLLHYLQKDSTNDIQFYGFIQLNLGIIAACAPPLKPLVGGVLRLPSTTKSNTRSGYGTNTIGGTKQSRIQSKFRASTMSPNNGWVRTNSDIELDEASFGSQTNITTKQGRSSSISK